MPSPMPSPALKAENQHGLMRAHAYIDGAWSNAKTGKTFDVINPATGGIITSVADCDSHDAERAVAAANAAFPAWKKALPKTRADILKKWFALIVENADRLADILSNEQGKPLAEAKGEILYGAAFVEWFAEEARRVYGRNIPAIRTDSRIYVTREAVGVCAAITPWNFPNSMITRKVAPALAAGCTIILKPAAQTPLSALALAALAEQAGMPKGVFNILTTTDSKNIGKILSTHTDIRKLSFTGSTEVGRTLMAQAAPTLKRLSMELGGNAPFIVFDDADLDAAVKGAIVSKFRNAGQTCVCTNRFYIQRGIYGAFAEKFADAIRKLKVGEAHEKDVTVGPLINKDAADKVQALVRDAVGKGAKLVCGGMPHRLGGLFYEPTLLLDATQTMDLAHSEIFGPVAALFPFDTEEEAVQLANDTEHGLASYFYTKDLGRAFRVAESLQYGMVGVNEGLISSEVAPFGGVKQSGFGREGALEGMDAYLETKFTLIGGL